MNKLISQMPAKARRLLFIDAAPREDNGWRTTEEGKHYRINKRGDVVAGPTAMVGNNVSEHPKSAAPSSSAPSSEWKQKMDAKKRELLNGDDSDQALFVYKAGFADHDTAVEAMNNGTASELVEQYFSVMEQNGDPEPTKTKRRNADAELAQEVRSGEHNGDYTQARIDYMRDWTGMSETEASATYQQFGQWFGGSWSHADTDTLDRYIDADGVYDGPIYRGMHFDTAGYDRFMQGLQPGATMTMNGHNSSWTTDRETAWLFSKNGERSVVIKCMKNKTAAPVSHLSEKGEDEILAHSQSQWTVLRVSEGSNRTEIYVVEAEKRMSKEDRDRRKLQQDEAPKQPEYAPLEQRMNEQSVNIHVTPPPKELAEKLASLKTK